MSTSKITVRLLDRLDERDQLPMSAWSTEYLLALREIVELHDDTGWGCNTCSEENRDFPCDTIKAVAKALKVSV